MSNKNIDKTNYALCGQLQKLSTNVFVGYQKKNFALLQNGTKIAYKNLEDKAFKEQNTFLTKDISVCEAEQQFSFTLQTPRRTFILKAKDEQTRIIWMRTITKIRKQIIRKRFKGNTNVSGSGYHNKSIQKGKIILSSTQNTLPNLSVSFLHETQRSLKSSNYIQTQRSMRSNSNVKLSNDVAKSSSNSQKDLESKKPFKELLKNVPEEYIKHNVFISQLKTKIQNLFTASFNEATYILFSSKSLYSSDVILEDNLTNMMLPPWAEINKMYKIVNNVNGNSMAPKLVLQIPKIIDLEESKQEKTCLKVRTQETVHGFYCTTVEEKDRLKEKIQLAILNYKEVLVNGKLTRKNYDNLIKLHQQNREQFHEKVKQLITKFIPNNHHYEPQVVIKIIQLSIPFIQQFVTILQNKKQNCNQVIHEVLKELHEQVKIHIKLTWDSSYTNMKGEDILKFLNALAAYHSIIKTHITDMEFMTGMKQLSKIYVRQSWKNFEDIILGIVQQEKKSNFFTCQDNQYIETNAIIDLFKFIYEVFELAAPCWEHKLHLHNVQKLMHRAMSVFITELKAAVDQTFMTNKQLIAISNNYFRFCLTVDEFYNQKFSTLQEKTKQTYEKLKQQYKELSNIILDKLAFDVRSLTKQFFQKGNFFKLNIQALCQMLRQSSENIQLDLFHPIWVKRYYEKIFSAIKEGVLSQLEKEISSKKKHNIKKLLETLDSISFDLVQVSKVLYSGKPKIDKQLNEVNILLSCQNHNEILKLIKGSGQDVRRVYMNIINLREDYYMGGPLYYLLNDQAADRSSVAMTSTNFNNRTTLKPTLLTVQMQRDMRASFSSYYMANDIDNYSMVDKSQDNYDQPLRLISEGYLMKCKINKKMWQKEYFRLKNGVLYFFQNQNSERCQNSIPVQQMSKVYTSNVQSLTFAIDYSSLHREKHIEFKCDSIQLRDRWLESLSLELKRVKNDEKVKKQKLKLEKKSKNYLIIDYEELINGKGYFSYTEGLK